MHIMADLSRKDEPATSGSADSETLLCSVTYDKARKLLTISPDFTIGNEHERHYSVTNGHGVKFSYRIEHVSAEPTPTELQEQREATRRVSMRLFTTDDFSRHSKLSRHREHHIEKIKSFRGKSNLDIPGRYPFRWQLHLYPAILFFDSDSSLFDFFVQYITIFTIILIIIVQFSLNNFNIISHSYNVHVYRLHKT